MTEPDALIADLTRLGEKYAVLVVMRREREAFEAQGLHHIHGPLARNRIAQGRKLAKHFPGVLRELDIMSASTLERRQREVAAELEAVQGQPAATAPERLWVRLMLDFHAAWREALAIKRWLGQQPERRAPDPPPALVERFRRWFSRLPQRCYEGAVDPQFVARYQRPPRGRLGELVWAQLAERYGLSRAELESLVFPDERPGRGS